MTNESRYILSLSRHTCRWSAILVGGSGPCYDIGCCPYKVARSTAKSMGLKLARMPKGGYITD